MRTLAPLIKKTWDENPLSLILGLAIILRLLAVFFARGWGMLDDHFLIIESAQSWVDGYDYNNWLPRTPENHGPTGHLFFYPGIHFLLFSFFKWIHINDPQMKMLIIRFFHALYSLITVYYGYRIVEKVDNRKSARLAGLLLAVTWIMPWLSVRNLTEMACLPLLILGFWQILKTDKPSQPFLTFLLAGFLFGLSFDIRPQTALFILGAGVVILIRRKWKELAGLALGSLLGVVLILGVIDYFLWGVPFAELFGYINVCYTEKDNYISLPWFDYFLVVMGLMIPPISLFLFYGFLRTWKKYLMLFLPAFLFFLFHSIFPNKQERFILPFLPFFIMLGSIGYYHYITGTRFFTYHRKLLKGSWIFFWIINLILLSVITVTYSKRSRVETMTYLSKYPDIRQILVADADDSPDMCPLFYLGQWPHCWQELTNGNTAALIRSLGQSPKDLQPRFILFTGKKDLQNRVVDARKSFPFLVYETSIEPGMIDNLLHWLNPHNKNKTVYIYKNLEFFPDKLQKILN